MNKVHLILTLSLVVVGIFYKDKLELYSNYLLSNYFANKSVQLDNIFTSEELSEYDGVIRKQLYLAVMGSIFDVSKGVKHYGKGSSYNYFVGKDGSRALITGNFKDESNNKDHTLDLTCDDLFVLLNWKKTFSEKYKYIGMLVGRYYQNDGKETHYHKQIHDRVKVCNREKEKAKEEKHKNPPCNISWNADEGTRVWCTKSSGGVNRSWVGVPRQLYKPGEEKPLCVCVNIHSNNDSNGLIKEYDDCASTATSCYIPNYH